MTDLFEPGVTTTTSLDLRRMQRDVRRRERRWRTLMGVAAGLVVFAIGASFSWNFLQAFKGESTEVPDFAGAGQGTVEVVIESGDAGDVIAQKLYDAGVIASTQAFTTEWANNPEDAQKIAPGHYLLAREMKAEYALIALLDPASRNETRITIPEGWTVAKIIERVASKTGTTVEAVQAVAADTGALGLPPEANGNLEGWLFPATYRFDPDIDPQEALSQMVAKTVSVLEANEVPRDQWLRVLTMASLVEREAKLDVDRPLIAGVIQNRLDAGMALELDSTVHYVVGNDGDVFTSADDRNNDSPYNTYKHTGLPPGPIGAPGELSIEAAIAPAEHDFFFFVTVDLLSGETRYAKTYAEHLKNVDILRKWYAENGG